MTLISACCGLISRMSRGTPPGGGQPPEPGENPASGAATWSLLAPQSVNSDYFTVYPPAQNQYGGFGPLVPSTLHTLALTEADAAIQDGWSITNGRRIANTPYLIMLAPTWGAFGMIVGDDATGGVHYIVPG